MPFSSNPQLVSKIEQKMLAASEHAIPFAQFMKMALYEPGLGYYAASHQQLGPTGDFVTAPHFCQDYGELIALQILEFWQVLDRPPSFTVVEMGAGQGLISADILGWLSRHDQAADLLPGLHWKIVETSASLVRWQQHYLNQRLQELDLQVPLEWVSLDDLQTEPIVGCFFSNELVDAFPVHLLKYQNGSFVEVWIGMEGDGDESSFVEKCGPLSPELKQYCDDMGLLAQSQDYPEGYRCEVNLAALDWIQSVSQGLKKGFVLTIDYGYEAAQLYSPMRQGGTLQCYTQQKSHDDPLVNIGNQDITSHVNFTALERYGDAVGLKPLGLTQQGLFLMALGLGDRLMQNNANSDLMQVNQTLQRREAFHALMNPMGLGGFKVLLQGKGLSPDQQKYPFRGLGEPLS